MAEFPNINVTEYSNLKDLISAYNSGAAKAKIEITNDMGTLVLRPLNPDHPRGVWLLWHVGDDFIVIKNGTRVSVWPFGSFMWSHNP